MTSLRMQVEISDAELFYAIFKSLPSAVDMPVSIKTNAMRAIPGLLLIAGLVGCSGATDIDIRPSRLEPIRSEVEIHPVWFKQAQSDIINNDSYLRPVAVDEHLYIAGQNGSIRSLDAENGKRYWKIETGESLSGGLGSADDLLLVGTRDGELLALGSSDGKLVWRSRLSSEVLTPPVAAGDVVVVRTIDGKLYGLDKDDGQRLWVYETTVPTLTLRGSSRPVIADGRVLTGLSNGKVVAVSLTDGKFLWEVTVAVPEGRSELERLVDIDGDPVLEDDIFYAASYHGRLVAINTSTGRLLWSRDLSSHSGLAIDDQFLYISDNESTIWALDRFNGAIIWKQDKLQQRSLTTPVIYRDYLVVGDFDGYLHWINRHNGEIVARNKVSDKSVFVPAVVMDDIVYVTDQLGMLIALRSN